jgi:hypothetical protein
MPNKRILKHTAKNYYKISINANNFANILNEAKSFKGNSNEAYIAVANLLGLKVFELLPTKIKKGQNFLFEIEIE